MQLLLIARVGKIVGSDAAPRVWERFEKQVCMMLMDNETRLHYAIAKMKGSASSCTAKFMKSWENRKLYVVEDGRLEVYSVLEYQ